MKTAVKSLVYSSFGFVLTICFAVAASAEVPPNTNRLDTGGNYNIMPPPSNMMFQITDNPTDSSAANIVWSHSGRKMAMTALVVSAFLMSVTWAMSKRSARAVGASPIPFLQIFRTGHGMTIACYSARSRRWGRAKSG